MRAKKTDEEDKENPGILYSAFKNIYAPVLLKLPIRIGVLLVFWGWLCSSLAVIPSIDVGLDQQLSMPEDSFVLKYFK